MAPTLWGPHARGDCPRCAAPQSIHCLGVAAPTKSFVCWNCGGAVPLSGLIAQRPSRVTVTLRDDRLTDAEPEQNQAGAATWQVGQLVALQPPGQETDQAADQEAGDFPANQRDGSSAAWVVKRVAALPGQAVRIDQAGWLEIDSAPAYAVDEQQQPLWLPVHDDRFRGDDPPRWRWWQHAAAGQHRSDPAEQAAYTLTAEQGWLRYHHLSVYQNLQADVPRDDFPANATESRWLNPVSQLRLTFRAVAAEPTMVIAVFHGDGQPRVLYEEIAPGTSQRQLTSLFTDPLIAASLSTASPSAILAGLSPTTPSIPIALRVLRGKVQLDQLAVWRPIRYRGLADRTPAHRVGPAAAGGGDGDLSGAAAVGAAGALSGQVQRVPAGHLLLLGDNVPISVDGRHWGFVPWQRIVGRIELVR